VPLGDPLIAVGPIGMPENISIHDANVEALTGISPLLAGNRRTPAGAALGLQAHPEWLHNIYAKHGTGDGAE
jgi:hypothetical protein